MRWEPSMIFIMLAFVLSIVTTILSSYKRAKEEAFKVKRTIEHEIQAISAGDVETFVRATKRFSSDDAVKRCENKMCQAIVHIGAFYCVRCGKLAIRACDLESMSDSDYEVFRRKREAIDSFEESYIRKTTPVTAEG